MPDTNKILNDAREIIAKQSMLPAGSYYTYNPDDGSKCYCAAAALGVAGGVTPTNLLSHNIIYAAGDSAVKALARAMHAQFDVSTTREAFESVILFNDHADKDSVVAAFDRAIKDTAEIEKV